MRRVPSKASKDRLTVAKPCALGCGSCPARTVVEELDAISGAADAVRHLHQLLFRTPGEVGGVA